MWSLLGHRGTTDGAVPLVLNALIASTLLTGWSQASGLAVRAMVARTSGVILWFLANRSAKILKLLH